MSPWFFADLSPLARVLVLGAHLLGGFLLGFVYFRALWWNTRLLAQGRRPMLAIAIAIGRFTLLGALLLLASREGVAPLLATVGGLFIGRLLVLRHVWEKIS